MKSRAVRFALHALFVVLLGAAAYTVWQKESENTAAAAAAHTFDERARVVSRSLLEIKSAQPGYVAAGQGEDYWVSRVDALVTGAREGLATLKPLARVSQSRSELDTALADLEDFEQMDRRAREYVRGGQRLLASDLVFSEGIEKMDAAAAAIERARLAESAVAQDGIRTRRTDQLLAATGAAAVAVLIMFALVPLPRQKAAEADASAREPANPRAGHGLKSPPKAAPVGLGLQALPKSGARAAAPSIAAPAPPPPPAVAASPSPGVDLPGIAALCTDLARVLDTGGLHGALERAAVLLNASGLVIWVADPDGRELTPVMAHGYPQHLLSRLGTIPRDGENATAAAFRTGLLQIVNSDANAPGAIAVPLVSSSGPLGVMAAEVRQGAERREATRAAAAIVAAQVSTLMAPPPAAGRNQAETVVQA